MEAADLGARLCQSAARSVYPCFAVAALPVAAFAFASYELADWLPTVMIWCAKPWLDRTILFVLSRAAFGQRTTPADLWSAQRQVWWSQFLFTWTVQRLSLWRSFTQPVYQLEGVSFWRAAGRVRQIRSRNTVSATMLTYAYSMAEVGLTLALFSLVFWFTPSGQSVDPFDVLAGDVPGVLALAYPMAYTIAVLLVEPFYVAGGFAMYLNRRAELEAWDIEQEFRRAFAR
jgi:hypothetical protein